MIVTILNEAGYDEAILGLSLSFKAGLSKAEVRSRSLCRQDGGHNKFLESIVVWLDIYAPRYWWSQFDTYRTGITKQSESTMHNLMDRPLRMEDFSQEIPAAYLEEMNGAWAEKDIERLKAMLPEGYIQRRVVCTNYKTLRNICQQRWGHRLAEWKEFILSLNAKLTHSYLLGLDPLEGDKWQ